MGYVNSLEGTRTIPFWRRILPPQNHIFIFFLPAPEAEKDLLNGDGGPTKNLMDTVPYLKPQHTPGKKYSRHSLSPTNDSGILKIINCCLRIWGMFEGYVGEFFGFLFFFFRGLSRMDEQTAFTLLCFWILLLVPLRVQESTDPKFRDWIRRS